MAPPSEELFALCEHAIEGTLDDAAKVRLETWVLRDPEARRAYVQYMYQHASLREASALTAPAVVAPAGRPRSPWRRTLSRTLAPVALAAGIVVGIGLDRSALTKDQAIATLETSQDAEWFGSTLPTVNGARLVPGRLHLANGVATIGFDSGARVTLEGSSDLELLSSGECRLRWGSLVAKIPAQHAGFSVKTGSSTIVDQGASFGVVANASTGTQVTVFEGRVQARHTNTGKVFDLKAGGGAMFDARTAVAQENPVREVATALVQSSQEAPPLTLTTSMGRGRAGFVQSGPKTWRQELSPWTSVLQVKNSLDGDYRRIIYLSFDLAPANLRSARVATLSLSLVPSGHGHAALVPDAEFSVFALTDDAQDGWNPDTVEWNTAPGKGPGFSGFDPGKTTKVASFIVPQGKSVGTLSIASPALLERINRDGNRLLTLIVVRDTVETRIGGYVHGFAGNHHPSAPAPALRLTFDEAPPE